MISVIVPIYKGRKYIKDIIAQVEAATKNIDYDVELLLVNDYPEESIDDYSSDIVNIVNINTEENIGIHGTRVKGLERSKGEYILFLDQDDKIKPSYFKSQLNVMVNCDAIVCRLKHGNTFGYLGKIPLEQRLNLNYLLNKGNAIFSPGQVLIKRKAIPDIWKNNILTINGADDWFLWICMAKQGCGFAVNPELLFEHVVHDNNLSSNDLNMSKSEYEISHILKKNNVLSEAEQISFERCLNKKNENRINSYDRLKKKFVLYQKWLRLHSEGKKLSDYFKEKNVSSVSIYGAGEVGHQIYYELNMDDIKVDYYIDRNANSLIDCVSIIDLESFNNQSNMIIISTLDPEKEIMKRIKELYKIEVCNIYDIIDGL